MTVFRWVENVLAKCLSLAVIEQSSPLLQPSVSTLAGRRRMGLGCITQTPTYPSYHPDNNLTPLLGIQSYRLSISLASGSYWTAIHTVHRPLRLRLPAHHIRLRTLRRDIQRTWRTQIPPRQRS